MTSDRPQAEEAMAEIDVWQGDHIGIVAQKAVEAAAFTGEDATFTFNDSPIVVSPGDSVEAVVRRYRISRGDNPDDHGTIVVDLQ